MRFRLRSGVGGKFNSSRAKYSRPSQHKKQEAERTVSPGGTAGGNRVTAIFLPGAAPAPPTAKGATLPPAPPREERQSGGRRGAGGGERGGEG